MPQLLTVWGRASSVNVMKVLWLLDELAIPFDRIEAGGAFGRTRDPDYAAMNPNATVPTLVMPHGYSLWESHSILRYLCRTQPGGNAFYPEAPEARADVERWMDWTLASMNEPMRVVFWALVRTPEAERDMAAVARARDAAERLWRIVEAQLDGRDYIAGGVQHRRHGARRLPAPLVRAADRAGGPAAGARVVRAAAGAAGLCQACGGAADLRQGRAARFQLA